MTIELKTMVETIRPTIPDLVNTVMKSTHIAVAFASIEYSRPLAV